MPEQNEPKKPRIKDQMLSIVHTAIPNYDIFLLFTLWDSKNVTVRIYYHFPDKFSGVVMDTLLSEEELKMIDFDWKSHTVRIRSYL